VEGALSAPLLSIVTTHIVVRELNVWRHVHRVMEQSVRMGPPNFSRTTTKFIVTILPDGAGEDSTPLTRFLHPPLV
jgi:hypothetical protein